MVQDFSDRIQAYRKNIRKEQSRLRNLKYWEKLIEAAKLGDKKAKLKIINLRKSAKVRMSNKRKSKKEEKIVSK